ncbi:serine/threonine-protein kinase SBK1-like [Protopterus annectens]|uniref:serine/threonine-protein kinase SBK1-like n=1 Tax=Protopterus annectens TaxID=7888 RepID=UPI001CF9E070|nr:serine/threonine-protein kinase SBK1-like [Protopterus annectens]XP_043938326.1 serine/threonine-protein kinase SBK1-like [Protopterus annectens]
MALHSGEQPADIVQEMLELTSQNLTRLEVKQHYKVIKELGRGKYGQVLLVLHRIRGTPMALKLMEKDKTKLGNFLYEYCAALYLSSHPNVIGMFGIVFETPNHYGFAYECALNKDLHSVIQPRVGVPEPAVKRCAQQICSALEFIHSKGFVYRDVKPENILIFDRECRKVKLTDFGLTRPKGTLLKLVSVILPYTAPELGELKDSAGLPIDYNLDVWAFGVLLFSILTGFFPWQHALPSDSFYEDFVIWQESQSSDDLPFHWSRFTKEALMMFGKLLAIDPVNRSPITEVLKYLDTPWKLENWDEVTEVKNPESLASMVEADTTELEKRT